MAHQDDRDRGFHAGKAQGAVDADAKMRDLEQQLEKAKRANSRSRIKAQLTQAQATITELRQEVAGLKLATPSGQAELREEILAYDFGDKEGG